MRPRAKASLWDMAEAVREEAERIRSTQRVLVKSGMRERQSQSQIRKAQTFEDIEKLIRTIIPVQDQVRSVLIPAARAISAQKKADREAYAAPIEPLIENPDID